MNYGEGVQGAHAIISGTMGLDSRLLTLTAAPNVIKMCSLGFESYVTELGFTLIATIIKSRSR